MTIKQALDNGYKVEPGWGVKLGYEIGMIKREFVQLTTSADIELAESNLHAQEEAHKLWRQVS